VMIIPSAPPKVKGGLCLLAGPVHACRATCVRMQQATRTTGWKATGHRMAAREGRHVRARWRTDELSSGNGTARLSEDACSLLPNRRSRAHRRDAWVSRTGTAGNRALRTAGVGPVRRFVPIGGSAGTEGGRGQRTEQAMLQR
jgi:hypothetical protein